MYLRWTAGLSWLLMAALSNAQDLRSTQPTVGIRRNPTQLVALVGARVAIRPGEMIEDATILIDGSIITAVGERLKISIPLGAEEIDSRHQTIYAGLIDAWSEADVPDPPQDRGAPHWNGNVMPQRNAAEVAGTVAEGNKKLRSQGITLRLIAPKGGIVQGTSCAVLTSDRPGAGTLVADRIWQHLQLTVPRDKSRDRYPNSPMGAMALLRQTFHDASWYEKSQGVYANAPGTPQPENNLALATLAGDLQRTTFVIDAPNERMALRADSFAREFSLDVIIKGSGREYRALEEIVRGGRPILLPVDFPEPPNVAAEAVERTLTQTELMHWKLGPENPARLAAAGATICLTSAGLKSVDEFLKQIRVAVDRGLDADKALAATTTVPAQLLGLESKYGTIARGKTANLVVADGDLFASTTKILATWVAGERFEIEKPPSPKPTQGTWCFHFHSSPLIPAELDLQITDRGQVKLSSPLGGSSHGDAAAIELERGSLERHRVQGIIDLSRLDEQWPQGKTRVSLIHAAPGETTELAALSLRLPDDTAAEAVGVPKDATAHLSSSNTAQSDQEKPPEPATGLGRGADSPLVDVVYPLGAYGLKQASAGRGPLLMSGATVWTCGPAGTLENADILVRDGKIVAVGTDIEVTADVEVLELSGKHISPGLIDCHSHIATDGGVNESGQAITAEVRVADFIDSSDITIYRQLAGGVTTSNILHGSANPIGGQNCVIKLRWGSSMDDFALRGAPPGIKFALGENVKQSNSGRSGRYPGSRMGVEQIIRDQLLAARFYDAEHRRYRSGERSGLPPRIDLQLEALAEVLRGERWIHCHSYRQDEIVAFLDTLEELNIQVGTLQHVLEGYKVADRLKRHGAMASSFADWWGYKFEVFDAIPYNGAMMHREGIVVSFNSDDAELGTHLNTEAAKATKYGNVSDEEALKFVTLNPARQLRIDDRTGSIEVGKDADLVIWSGPPLSTFSRCEQTWIDGRQYFSLEQDAELRRRDLQIRSQLIQEILSTREKKAQSGSPDKDKTDALEEAARWERTDVFCGCREGTARGDQDAR